MIWLCAAALATSVFDPATAEATFTGSETWTQAEDIQLWSAVERWRDAEPGLFEAESFNNGIAWQDTDYSPWIQTLFESGLPFLGLVVVFFSGIFPLAKTLTAAIIFRQGAEPSPKLAALLNMLGKWSMLDVFLAALLIGISQISIYIGFETRAGLYYFAAGVLLNNAATMRLTFTRFK